MFGPIATTQCLLSALDGAAESGDADAAVPLQLDFCHISAESPLQGLAWRASHGSGPWAIRSLSLFFVITDAQALFFFFK